MVFIFRRCWEEENSRQFVWTAEEEEEGSREITLLPPTLALPHKTTRPQDLLLRIRKRREILDMRPLPPSYPPFPSRKS